MQRLAMTQNPFDPNVSTSRGRIRDQALILDEHAALLEHFCWDITDLRHDREKIDNILHGTPHPPEGPRGPVQQEQIFLIRGSRGSGKTSLASYIRLATAYGVPRGSQWSILGHRFTPEMVPDEAAIKGQIDRIQEEVLQQFGVTPGSVFVLLENVPWSRLNQVSSLYEKCALHFRLFVVTTDDTTEDADELESWSPPFEPIMRYPLKDEDVLTYVQHRVSR